MCILYLWYIHRYVLDDGSKILRTVQVAYRRALGKFREEEQRDIGEEDVGANLSVVVATLTPLGGGFLLESPQF